MEEASPISACLSPLSAPVNGSCSTHCSSSFLASSLVPHLHSNRTPHHNKASSITSGLQDNRTQPEHCESNSSKEIISQERKEASDFAFARQATHSLQAQDGKSLSSTTEDCSVSSTFSSFEAHPLCGQTDTSNHSVFSDTSSHTSASSAGSCSSREEAHSWNCSVCTYRNPSDAFKCHMCDVRKGISTRKPRVNPEVLAQQVARQQQQIQAAARKACAKQAEKSHRSPSSTSKRTEAEQFDSPKQKRKTKEMKTEPVKESEARSSKENGETSNSSKENGNTLVARSSKENGNGQDSSNLFDGLSRDRSETITVNNVTVRITEYLPRTHMESAKSNGKVKNKSKS